jgi:predicted HicB family RNase H-like nuclease
MTARTSTAIRLKPDLHERLVEEAAARDVSINFLVNKACAFFLDRLIPVDEMQWTREP